MSGKLTVLGGLAIWMFVLILPLIRAKRNALETADILVSEKAIQGPIFRKAKPNSRRGTLDGYAMSPNIEIRRIGWNEVEKVEEIRAPDLEFGSAYVSRALRLLVPDGKLIIFSNIQGYEELSEFIRRHVNVDAADQGRRV
ncbi:MAG: hypothetical protein AB7R40_26275 [Nitrospiraceae bacterium]